MLEHSISFPTHPVCQHVGCESNGHILPGIPPTLTCKRCQRRYTEFDDLDGGHTTGQTAPLPHEPFTPSQMTALIQAGVMMPVHTPYGPQLVPIEFR